MSYTPPGTPWNNGFAELFNRGLRTECLKVLLPGHSQVHCSMACGTN
ncbi:integrase core domain-containing protein [Nocardia fluminea]